RRALSRSERGSVSEQPSGADSVAIGQVRAILLFSFLLVLAVQELLPIFRYVFVPMRVAYDPVHGSADVAAADIADDRASGRRHTLGMRGQPIVIFDGRIDAAVLWKIDAHPDQRLPRIPQELPEFVGGAFPEGDVERFLFHDGAACG